MRDQDAGAGKSGMNEFVFAALAIQYRHKKCITNVRVRTKQG